VFTDEFAVLNLL